MKPCAVHLFALSLILAVAAEAAAAPSFQPLGFLPGRSMSVAEGISADGGAVVGYSGNNASDIAAFRWTADEGLTALAPPAGADMTARAVAASADGAVIVGYQEHTTDPATMEPVRWTADGVLHPMGYLPGGRPYGYAAGVSADGAVVVGASSRSPLGGLQAFRWTEGGGMVGLDLPAGADYGAARGVSGDGSVVAGHYDLPPEEAMRASRWTAGGPAEELAELAGGLVTAAARGISADGRVVVGESIGPYGYEAVRWTDAGGVQSLVAHPEDYGDSSASAASADGSIIVGNIYVRGVGTSAFLWDEADGLRLLQDVLARECGLDVTGWMFIEANGISADGLTIAGYGYNPDGGAEAFVATIPEPATLALMACGCLALVRRLGLCRE